MFARRIIAGGLRKPPARGLSINWVAGRVPAIVHEKPGYYFGHATSNRPPPNSATAKVEIRRLPPRLADSDAWLDARW